MELYYSDEENISPKPIEWWKAYYKENISKAPEDCGWETFDDWWSDMLQQGLINKQLNDKKVNDMKTFKIKTKTTTFTVNAKDKATAIKLVKMKIRHNVKDHVYTLREYTDNYTGKKYEIEASSLGEAINKLYNNYNVDGVHLDVGTWAKNGVWSNNLSEDELEVEYESTGMKDKKTVRNRDKKVKDSWTLIAENIQSQEEAKQILTTMGYNIHNIGWGVVTGDIYFNERNNENFASYKPNTKELYIRDSKKKVKDTDEYIYKLSSYISFIHDKVEQLKEYVKGVERFKDNASDEIKDTIDTLVNNVNKACEDVINAEQDAQDKINK